ncbi:hypothetical protein KAFR_0D01630 [Kazachstania africana CBS 2517]|uniref:Uncharacterized protein n=1 Tax=Kazachstania africana (strain ATCC 22294 / BCRC 22015 / CBS 2517 / CECT 1963 / NBRC 1671 / NRRL Y-8276) TaxID=1071382 RepID=H2ATV9_KAZAF|nr:hypothetical protein KAFR_0D01630 [Kazachstania africana CBS 2517]CCF57809.1 hypothetical protein KAFR_0D01630 [Kazachstania africana CBS 2517]
MFSGKEIRIITLLTIDTTFFFLELIIGYMSHSLALIADSFHMLNDIFSLLVALWAVNVAKNRDPDAKYTYGWKRAEILGALINAVFLIALCFSILIEALQRLIEPQIIENPKLVLYVGFAGLISNFVGLFLFHDHGHGHSHDHGHSHSHASLEDVESHSHSHSPVYTGSSDEQRETSEDNGISGATVNEMLPDNVVDRIANENSTLLNNHCHDTQTNTKKKHRSLNMHGVFLHVMGDALGNVGVIVAALFIWKTDYYWKYYTDPLVSLFITIIIFSSAIPLSRKASKILLQATPSTISADDVQRDILAIPGVLAIHDFHIWNLTESIFIASIHVQIDCEPDKYLELAKLIRNIFHQHGIHSATVQPEFVSENIDPDMRNRFSRIAGGSNNHDDYTSFTNSSGTDVKDSGRPSAYGATTPGTGCVIDEAVNCNPQNCL